MDPATIYAITVTLIASGMPPSFEVEPLPPEWTMADCIKDHEEKLAGKPNTMARCVSRDRPFKGPFDTDEEVVYAIGIIFGNPSQPLTVQVSEPTPPVSLDECEKKFAARFANHPGIRGYCFKSRTVPTTCDPHRMHCPPSRS